MADGEFPHGPAPARSRRCGVANTQDRRALFDLLWALDGDFSLKGVTLSQTVRYLHNIESANRQLSVKSLRIKSQKSEGSTLDVTFSVSSFEPA